MNAQDIMLALNILTRDTGVLHMLSLESTGSGSIIRRDGKLVLDFLTIDKLARFCNKTILANMNRDALRLRTSGAPATRKQPGQFQFERVSPASQSDNSERIG